MVSISICIVFTLFAVFTRLIMNMIAVIFGFKVFTPVIMKNTLKRRLLGMTEQVK